MISSNLVGRLGDRFLALMRHTGGMTILLAEGLAWMFVPPFKVRHVFNQMYRIGVSSLPLVFMTSLFTGMVLALQSAYAMRQLEGQLYIANLVALSMTRELGPVLTALVVAGRVGAAMTAEIGTMQVTEQIDALRTLATDPIRYLVVPRLAAGMLMIPFLTVYADFVGILGGYLVAVGKLDIGSAIYLKMTWDSLALPDLFTGLVKSFFFSLIIVVVGCYQGFITEGGAEGVGRATTMSVVVAFTLIIAVDCLITALFYFVF